MSAHDPTVDDTGEEDICLAPQPGSVLLFPGWLPHAVLPHDGDEPRISISFNADFIGTAALTDTDDGLPSVWKDTSDAFEVDTANHAFREASTDQEWLAAARTLRNAASGQSTALLRNAWSSDALVWSVLQLPLSSRQWIDTVLSEISLGQPEIKSTDAIVATLHELVCLLTAQYAQAERTRA